jgi:glycosyltransferase involved in cell wall biosynthesis
LPVKLSIITPSYNQAQFLEETLRSVLAQRDQIHEYFVIDDGSTDASVEVIRKYENQIDWWDAHKNAGQATTVNTGLSRATGDVLAWLNSDDVYLPGALAQVREAFDRHPDWDALTAYHVRMDDQSRIQSMHRIPAENSRLARLGMHHGNQQTFFFRRSIYERVGPLDPELRCVLDGDLWCRMFDAGAKWGHIPRYLAGFRQHGAAKNSSDAWKKRYSDEGELMRRRYPQYNANTFKHRMGIWAYRATQMLSGRQPRAWWEMRRHRGATLSEVFGIGKTV